MQASSRAAPAGPGRLSFWAALALVALSCRYEASERCGEASHFDEASNSCACDEGAVIVGGGCEPCAAGDVVREGKCECPEGSRRGPDGTCEVIPAALGGDCSATSPCMDPVYNHCAPDPDLTDYCTIGTCTTTADCPATYTCTVWEAEPYCERPPTGLGDVCSESAPCDGEADFCVPQGNVCLLQGCTVELDDCPSGYTDCCDLTPLGITAIICVPEGQCPF